jgi:hypothetical protein
VGFVPDPLSRDRPHTAAERQALKDEHVAELKMLAEQYR